MQISPSFIVADNDSRDDDNLWMEKNAQELSSTRCGSVEREKSVLLDGTLTKFGAKWTGVVLLLLSIAVYLLVMEMRLMNARSQEMLNTMNALLGQVNNNKGHQLCVTFDWA
ncbi:hypothetical protein IV203_015676 [Nitzschia inconspicua]|uniref:Uncharacterized protein n=1 Tax=Nitzschia inconspicua TaxID=303405 RepID=A0A9K3LBP6_9STRA|nr:hypothetical protein IV203_015676 [Nitzschia inconspicua]